MPETLSERPLTRAAREALESGDDQIRARLARRKHFIEHPAAVLICERLGEALEDHPTSGDAHLLVVGDSGMGKTQLVRHFSALHGCGSALPHNPTQIPILEVGMVTPSAKGFLAGILEKLWAPYPASAGHEVLYPLVLRLLRRVGLKILVIDEIHHIKAGHRDERLKLLFVIKQLGNDLNITIVGCGTIEALLALQLDPQLERRFEPLPLTRWANDGPSWGLLNSIETTLPLPEPSFLGHEPTATWILSEAEGLTGEIDRLVRRAAVRAIRTNQPCIDLALLKAISWIRPSLRRRQAETVIKQSRPAIEMT